MPAASTVAAFSVIASFEKSPTATLTTSRKTDDLSETTTVWKRGGRVDAIRNEQSGRVALIERGWTGSEVPVPVWLPFSTTNTRNHYEISEWPLTLTASVWAWARRRAARA